MGMDFVALMRYRRTRDVVRRINALENQTRPLSADVQSLRAEQGFSPQPWSRAYWVAGPNARQVRRPRGPSLQATLRTVDGFFLTFGQGICCADHLLRWWFFLTDPRWQRAMLAACDTIADLLGSTEGVVMSDFHPAYSAFLEGASFDECLRGVPPGEAELGSLSQLHRIVRSDGTWESHGYWHFRRDPSRQASASGVL
jgi:hypothetical protein